MNTNNNYNEETVVMDAQTVGTTEKIEKEESGSSWKSVVIGGVSGIVLGAAGSFAANAAVPNHEDPIEPAGTVSNITPVVDHPVVEEVADVAHNVTDDMTFSQAFAAARTEVGPGGVFTWHGNIYSTYYAEEWNAMDADARNEYAESVNAAMAHSGAAHGSASGHVAGDNPDAEIHADVENHGDEDDHHAGANNQVVHTEDDDISGEPEIHVYSVNQVDMGDGEVAYVATAQVDGHIAEFQDLDGDGQIDQIVVDANDDMIGEDSEVIDVEGSGLTVADLVTASELEQPMPDDDLYADNPDYTNDADVSSFA